MKWSMATVGVIILGLIGVSIIFLFQHLTTSSENDYYLLKEITESAMFDAIDISYYRETGEIKIVREKFVENFTRRYAESTLFIGGNYIISFYDIMEEPPKVSLIVNTNIIDYQIYSEDTKNTYGVLNNLTGIFEYPTNKKSGDVYTKKSFEKKYYSMPSVNKESGSVGCNQPFYLPSEISQRAIEPGSIKISFETSFSNKMDDILQAYLYREVDWVTARYENKTNYFNVNSDTYATGCEVKEIYYYDCVSNVGNKNENMQCDKYNNFWIHWDGSCDPGFDNVLLMIDMNFEYREYEY